MTTRTPGRRGSLPAAKVSGPSRATSWSAPVRLGAPCKAPPSRCLPRAAPPSWAGRTTTRIAGRRGSLPAAAVCGPSRATSWSAPVRSGAPCKAPPSPCLPTGRTAIVGGPNDNTNTGAAWVFTRSDGVWTQQGDKLVGTGAAGTAVQGTSVALSVEGHTAIVGGPNDNTNSGAAWVFVELTIEDCRDGGWLNFPSPPGPFTNQRQCLSYFLQQYDVR